jgi:hypothetical protein
MFKAIWEFLKPLMSFLKSVYSESSGAGSSTRVHIGAILAFILGVGISFAVAVHLKKITIEQFDNFLSSGAIFITSTAGTLYSANQVGNWAQKREDNKKQGDIQ